MQRPRARTVDVHCNVLSGDKFGPVIEALNAADLTRHEVHILTSIQAPSNEFHAALIKPQGSVSDRARITSPGSDLLAGLEGGGDGAIVEIIELAADRHALGQR